MKLISPSDFFGADHAVGGDASEWEAFEEAASYADLAEDLMAGAAHGGRAAALLEDIFAPH